MSTTYDGATRALRTIAALWLSSVSLAVADDLSAQRAAVAALDTYIEQARRDWEVPGVAVGVVLDDTVIFAKGYGLREAGKSPALDTRSLFEIGSLTKAMTAAAVALLVDEGRLRWDDRVIDRLPEFRLADPWVTAQVTVRDLLANRVGFEGGAEVVAPMTSRQVLDKAPHLRQWMSFRDSMAYSNSLYAIAGELVAAVSGMSWAQFVEQRLFARLGMQSTFASVDTAKIWRPEHLAPSMYGQAPAVRAGIEDALHANVTMPHWHTPHGARAIPWQISLRGGAASGSAVSNLDDLLQWTRWHLSNDQRLLRVETLRELHTPQTLIREAPSFSFTTIWNEVDSVSPGRGRAAYALGWFSNSYRGYRYLDHGGALLGATSVIAMIPERRMGVVILANSYGRGGDGMLNDVLALRIFDALLGAAPHDWSRHLLQVTEREEREQRQAETELQRARLDRVPPSLPLSGYVGNYENAQLGRVSVVKDGKELFLQLPGAFKWRLTPWQGDIFRLQVATSGVDLMQFFATFHVGPRGGVVSLDPGWVILGESLSRVE